MNNVASAEAVMRKALGILKGELSREEYLLYLEAITPKIGDATKKLRDKGRGARLEDCPKRSKEI